MLVSHLCHLNSTRYRRGGRPRPPENANTVGGLSFNITSSLKEHFSVNLIRRDIMPSPAGEGGNRRLTDEVLIIYIFVPQAHLTSSLKEPFPTHAFDDIVVFIVYLLRAHCTHVTLVVNAFCACRSANSTR